MINYVEKRNGSIEDFSGEKITNAVVKAMTSISLRSKKIPEEILDEVIIRINEDDKTVISVEDIHQTVEAVIMDMGLHDLARSYIVFRTLNRPNIFRKRGNLKPYEYPNLIEYLDAIRHSYWLHTEFNYSPDIQNMKVDMTSAEVSAVERAMLAISQIEVAVKTFWAKIGDKLQKPEVQAVGATFAESEVRHADAYSNLIEIMGLNEKFKEIVNVPAIKKRIEYLEHSLSTPVDDKEYFYNIILFSMFIENVSLFSQFLIIMSFNKHKNILKGISNAVEATSKEEDIHARFGFELVNIIKEENPEWWDKDVENNIKSLTRQAYKAESAIVDWIFEEGDLKFIPKDTVKEFLKIRFNESLEAIGVKSIYTIDPKAKKSTEWFTDELLGTKNVDFFDKRSTAYSKKTKSFTTDDLF